MLGMTARQPRHCRHTLVALALTAVAEMMMPCTFTRRDTCSDCSGQKKKKNKKKCDQPVSNSYSMTHKEA